MGLCGGCKMATGLCGSWRGDLRLYWDWDVVLGLSEGCEVVSMGLWGCLGLCESCVMVLGLLGAPEVVVVGLWGCLGLCGGCEMTLELFGAPEVVAVGLRGCLGLCGNCEVTLEVFEGSEVVSMGLCGCLGLWEDCGAASHPALLTGKGEDMPTRPCCDGDAASCWGGDECS